LGLARHVYRVKLSELNELEREKLVPVEPEPVSV